MPVTGVSICVLSNWEIVVGLVWYDSQTIVLYGYDSFGTLIEDNLNWVRNWLYPALSAVAYPWIKLGFGSVYTWGRSLNERAEKYLSKPGYITATEYLEMLDKHEENVKKLTELINSKSDTQLKLEERTVELQQEKEAKAGVINDKKALEQSTTEAIKKLEEKIKLTNKQYFNGAWNVIVKNGNIELNEDVLFVNGQGSVVDGLGKSVSIFPKGKLTIERYLCDPESRQASISFTMSGFARMGGDMATELKIGSAVWDENFTLLQQDSSSPLFKMVRVPEGRKT